MSQSRSRHRPFPADRLRRRDLLRVLGAAPVLPLAGCGSSTDSSVTPPTDGGGVWDDAAFRHGVASGDPEQERVILWTRVSNVSGSVPVHWEVALDEAFESVVRSDADPGPSVFRTHTDAGRDYTVKVDAAGLLPGTTYFYRFTVGAARSPVGRTRTAGSGAIDRVRLALVSCSNYSAGYFHAYRVIARQDLDAVVHVGDYLYEGGGEGEIGRPHDPPYEIVTLSDYRRRHAQYRTDPDLQAMTAAHPLIPVWDDHESTNNSWIDGAQNHQPDREGDWEERKLASAIAYDEWLPIRLPDPMNPLRIWRRIAFGDLVELFMLDTRLQRNAPETDTSITGSEANDPSRSMLGIAQREWLMNGLLNSRDAGMRWRVLGQQTMMAPHRNNPDPSMLPLPYLPPAVVESLGLRQGGGNEGSDNWGAYVFERDTLIRHLRDNAISNNIVLTGDVHTGWACDVVEDPYTPFNPITSGVTGAPGYNALTGAGSVAVEFTGMSVTSNNLIDTPGGAALGALWGAAVRGVNPNARYHNPAAHGFVLVDIDRDGASGSFWNVGTVLEPLADGDDGAIDATFRVAHAEAGARFANHLRRV